MSRLSRLPSLSPVGCQHTAASLPLFDVKIVKTSVLKPCRLPTYSCKFDRNLPLFDVKISVLTNTQLQVWQKPPCLMSRLSRLPSLSPVGCQHTAASLTKHPCLMSRLSRLLCLSPVGSQHTAASLTETSLFHVKTSVLTNTQLQVWQKPPCLMSRLSRLPSLSPVGCQHTAASLTKHPCLMSRLSRLLSLSPVGSQHTAASLTETSLFHVKTSVLTNTQLQVWQTPPCLMSRLSRLPSLSPVGCQHTAASLTKNTRF